MKTGLQQGTAEEKIYCRFCQPWVLLENN